MEIATQFECKSWIGNNVRFQKVFFHSLFISAKEIRTTIDIFAITVKMELTEHSGCRISDLNHLLTEETPNLSRPFPDFLWLLLRLSMPSIDFYLPPFVAICFYLLRLEAAVATFCFTLQ